MLGGARFFCCFSCSAALLISTCSTPLRPNACFVLGRADRIALPCSVALTFLCLSCSVALLLPTFSIPPRLECSFCHWATCSQFAFPCSVALAFCLCFSCWVALLILICSTPPRPECSFRHWADKFALPCSAALYYSKRFPLLAPALTTRHSRATCARAN